MPQIIQFKNGPMEPINAAATDLNGAVRCRIVHIDTGAHTIDVLPETGSDVLRSYTVSDYEELIIEKNPTERLKSTTHAGNVLYANSIGYRDNAYPHESFKPLGLQRTLNGWNLSFPGTDDDAFGGATLVRVFNNSANATVQIRIYEELSPGNWGTNADYISNAFIIPYKGIVIRKKPEQRILGQGINHLGVTVAY